MRKEWLHLGILLALISFIGCNVMEQAKPLAVEWLGWPTFAKPYGGIDPGFYGSYPPPDILIDKTKEIGLREDGVCVWRPLIPQDK